MGQPTQCLQPAGSCQVLDREPRQVWFVAQIGGGVGGAAVMGVPKKPLHLPTNYRTHSGILNPAAAVVDVLRHHFPMVSYTLLVLKPSDTRLFRISIGLAVITTHNS